MQVPVETQQHKRSINLSEFCADLGDRLALRIEDRTDRPTAAVGLRDACRILGVARCVAQGGIT